MEHYFNNCKVELQRTNKTHFCNRTLVCTFLANVERKRGFEAAKQAKDDYNNSL